jgi:hypothetical protein
VAETPLAKGEKFMETKKATIKREDIATYLILELDGKDLKITLTDDNPNLVKTVFNDILKELKKGTFRFELEDNSEDLFHHICKEYITQLNAEIVIVYRELEEFKLIETKN